MAPVRPSLLPPRPASAAETVAFVIPPRSYNKSPGEAGTSGEKAAVISKGDINIEEVAAARLPAHGAFAGSSAFRGLKSYFN